MKCGHLLGPPGFVIFLVYILFKGSDEEKEDDNKLKLDLDKLWTELKAWHSSR